MLGAEAAAILIDSDGDDPITKQFLKGGVECQRRIFGNDEVEMDAAVADMAKIANHDIREPRGDLHLCGVAEPHQVAAAEREIECDQFAPVFNAL